MRGEQINLFTMDRMKNEEEDVDNFVSQGEEGILPEGTKKVISFLVKLTFFWSFFAYCTDDWAA